MKKGWYLKQKEKESEVEREIEKAVKRVDKAFATEKITYKDLTIVLPLLVIGLFRNADMLNDTEAQKKFFRDLENTVYITLQLAKEKGIGL